MHYSGIYLKDMVLKIFRQNNTAQQHNSSLYVHERGRQICWVVFCAGGRFVVFVIIISKMDF